MNLSIVIPVMNEQDNIRPMIDRVRESCRAVRQWECLFIDDGSTDDTFTVLSSCARIDPRIKVIRLRRNCGQSAAMQAGFDAARGDVIATLDGDLQNDPADLPMMLNKLEEGYDVVLGLRALRQDKFLLRKVPSRIANWVIRRVLHVPFRDFGCTLRVARRDYVTGLALYGEMHRFITALLLQQGARVVQVPVQHHPRTAGKSKYTITRTVRVILDLMTVKFLASYQTRPMHVFGTFGLVCMLAGTFSIAAAIVMKYTTGPGMTANPLFLLGVLGELIGVQFLSLGLLGEVLARIYFESQGKTAYTVREMLNIEAKPAPGSARSNQAA
ncbi:MAG: glycosyltransferase family 2 protein [Gemmataceae bacterium]